MENKFFSGGDVGFKFIPFEQLADKVGVHVVVLRFVTALLAGYPFTIVYLFFPKKNETLHHVYFIICGLLMSYFCFGSDCVYTLISILVSYISFTLLGTGISNVIFSFVFQMGYLLGAYLVYASDGYDIKWTTPQCLLCLKLIGVAWDCYDGRVAKDKLRPYQMESAYAGVPTFVELMGYSYFFGSFLAGPLFSFRNYVRFTEDTLIDKEADRMSRFYTAAKRIIAGLFAAYIFVTFDPQYPCDFLCTADFKELGFLTKCTIMMLTYHIHFCKYACVWMLSESICIMVGISYNGTKDGKSKWDGVRNFKYRKVLFGPFFQDMLEGFNINTSRWSGSYIFRRLAFLGNKTVSHILTLAFLCVWHGFYIGYVIVFAIEFFLIIFERNLSANMKILSGRSYEELSLPLRLLIRVVGFTYRAYITSFAGTAFILLRWNRIKVAYDAVNYWGVISLVVFFGATHLTSGFAAKKKREDKLKES